MIASGRTVLDTIHVLDTKEVGHDSFEICSTALASYDETSRELQVDLDCFVRHFEMRGKDLASRPPWLPRKDQVKTHVGAEETADAAREIAESWGKKVRKSIPSLGEWNARPAWLNLPAA